jgi:hypothetical protein
MKQTAVEFLMGKLFDPSTMVAEQIQWFEEAKAMQKEQIMQSVNDGKLMALGTMENKSLEKYYNETFNTKEK